jgi:hypothetical protein
MMMSYGSNGTGVTTDIDSYIYPAPYCSGIVIKEKSTHLCIQEETYKNLKAVKKKERK